jgi:predicted O-methyltransferase YrrM
LPNRTSEAGILIKEFRKDLGRSTSTLEIRDLGAGATEGLAARRQRTVGQIARSSPVPERKGELLYRICKHYQPQNCLEFGTNLGVSALYQLAGLESRSRFISMEGDPGLAALARENIQKNGFEATVLEGEFSDLLENHPELMDFHPDYVFVDGNHTEGATLAYFHHLLPKMEAGGMIIWDDINWSAGMRRAWDQICAHPEVSLSIDLYFVGIIWIRRSQAKEHFCLRALL